MKVFIRAIFASLNPLGKFSVGSILRVIISPSVFKRKIHPNVKKITFTEKYPFLS